MSYQVLNLRPLADGGNGDVFLGQRSDNGEFVVVKFLREYRLPHARRAFAREVKVLQRRHSGLVSLLFANLEAQRPFYVMPYLAAGSITRYAGRLNEKQLQNVAFQLATAIAGIHALGDAHGDVKPDNVLLSQDGRPQLADPLGAGSILTIVFSQNHGGTPGYWAPEVRSGGAISRAGDVYSFGAMLSHLLTGRRPVDGQAIDADAWSYVQAPRIRQLIAACCQTDPAARPTMQEVLQMLNGRQWSDIQVARRQGQQTMMAAILAIVAFVGLTKLAK